jgi:hypothetical protein
MSYSQWWKQITFGLLSWIGPFVVAFFFVNPNGSYRIDEMFFKSIMVVTGAFFGVVLSYFYFASLEKRYVQEGIIVGLSWLAINWLLDLALVFSGFFQMSVGEYFMSIGFRYLSIPIYTIGMGLVLKYHTSRLQKQLGVTPEIESTKK